MKRLLQPHWLLLLNCLPLLAGSLVLAAQFSVLQPYLSVEAKTLWFRFALAWAGIGLSALGYAAFQMRRKASVHWLFGLLSALCGSVFLYVLLRHESVWNPWNLPRWITVDPLLLVATAFMMPAIIYGLLVVVLQSVSDGEKESLLTNFLAAAAIPLALYFGVNVILPLWQADTGYSEHVLAVIFLGMTTAFFFFLMRIAYILLLRRSEVWKRYELLWKIPIAVVMPLLGLMLNNHDWGSRIAEPYMFGRFSDPWFYALAVINGVLVCLPARSLPVYRLVVWVGRWATLPYTLYFLLVMLPFFPLSLVAMVLAGLGLLMLTPLLLAFFYVGALVEDGAYLRTRFAPITLWATGLLAFCFLPAVITARYWQHRSNLHQALEYVYEPDFAKKYSIDTPLLLQTLDVVQRHKSGSRTHTAVPYLSAWYNWIVLDNLSLADHRVYRLQKVFSGSADGPVNNTHLPLTGDKGIRVENAEVRSRFDAQKKRWESWVDLRITADSIQRGGFATVFELPSGAWIGDYYLDMDNRREKGILAEKKSAAWIYNEITSEQQDPGILHYLSGNQVQFCVFPFAKGQTRTTGFQVLHTEPINLTIDGRTCSLGASDTLPAQPLQAGKCAWIPAAFKATLPKVVRQPYYHFIVDVSKNKERNKEWYLAAISKLLKNNLIRDPEVRITLCNQSLQELDFKGAWQAQLQQKACEGGFFLDRAMRQILSEQYLAGGARYPIMVAVTDDISNALIDGDFLDLRFAYPDNRWYYVLDPFGNLNSYSLFDTPKVPQSDSTSIQFSREVRAWNGPRQRVYYLPENNRSDLLFIEDGTSEVTDFRSGNIETALGLQGEWMELALRPHLRKSAWLPMLRHSFSAQIMTPLSAWIALENEGQKAALLRKQEAVLSGHGQLDAGDEARRMSEPGLPELLLCCLLWIFGRRWIRARWRVAP